MCLSLVVTIQMVQFEGTTTFPWFSNSKMSIQVHRIQHDRLDDGTLGMTLVGGRETELGGIFVSRVFKV